jgi:hypothetical protein
LPAFAYLPRDSECGIYHSDVRSVPVFVIGRVGGLDGEVDALAVGGGILTGEAAVEALRRREAVSTPEGSKVHRVMLLVDMLQIKPCECKYEKM